MWDYRMGLCFTLIHGSTPHFLFHAEKFSFGSFPNFRFSYISGNFDFSSMIFKLLTGEDFIFKWFSNMLSLITSSVGYFGIQVSTNLFDDLFG